MPSAGTSGSVATARPPPSRCRVRSQAPPTGSASAWGARRPRCSCQGGFCNYRATGLLHGIDELSAQDANRALLDFLQERWKGTWPILYGDQLRQVRFDDWVFQGVLDVAHAPGADGAAGTDGAGAIGAQSSA